MFVVVGVTGGIAAYKTVQLVRLLVLDGHDVHVIPTEDALRFVGRTTWEAISRNPVTTSVHDDVASVRHVALGAAAELVIVAPATADFLAKMAAGLADDLLGTTLLATTAPVVVAPAMHTAMWQHPATAHNVATLADRGVHIVGPDEGRLTGNDSGPGRMSEPDHIHRFAMGKVLRTGDLAGLTVLVTTGGTREPIDPVRYIGNRSSGRQGWAIALAAADRGADVQLVAAHVDADVEAAARTRPDIAVTRVGSAAEMQVAADRLAVEADVVVMAAAVADFRVDQVKDAKLTKEDLTGDLTLTLTQNPDIVAGLAARRRHGQTIVAFAAETSDNVEELLARGRRKRERKGVDLIAVNSVGWHTGFEVDTNGLWVIGHDGTVVATATGSKREMAEALWTAIWAARGQG